MAEQREWKKAGMKAAQMDLQMEDNSDNTMALLTAAKWAPVKDERTDPGKVGLTVEEMASMWGNVMASPMAC